LLVSVIYVVVCRLLELIVLVGGGDRTKELEILVLRHELSILRRQVNRPRVEPQDRLLLAAFCRAAPGTLSSCNRRRCCTGITGWWLATGRTRIAALGDRRSAVTCAS
jgi:hypothetical protein